MPKYMVFSMETVFYSSLVEAGNEQDAMRKIQDSGVEMSDAIDAENFDVTGAELFEDKENIVLEVPPRLSP